jgi:hypothetical protein
MKNGKRDLSDRTKRFALSAIRTFSMLPKTKEAQVLGKQLLRSRTSVGANYREAYRARSKAEFISKCGDSLASLKRPLIGLNCSSMGRLPRRINFQLFGKNAMNLSRFLLRF